MNKMKKREIVEISRTLEKGLHVIRVNNVTSGVTIDFGDGDSGMITFRFDASRFDVEIRKV